jgi:hypothetical protein
VVILFLILVFHHFKSFFSAAIKLTGNGHMLRNNLIANLLWTGSYDGRDDELNFEYNAGVYAVEYSDLIMEDNVVAGSQRVGYRLRPERCGSTTLWRNNEAHGVLIGVIHFAVDLARADCYRLSGFKIWRAYDFGIYTTGDSSIEVDNVIISDSKLGIYNYQMGPNPLSHICKTVKGTLTHSLIAGDTGTLPCTDSLGGTNILRSGRGRSWRVNGGHLGISWLNVPSGGNGAPLKSFRWVISYPSMCGLMTIRGV